jgi:hypothetical protein
MAGRGPAPKPPEKRAGKSKDPHLFKVITASATGQPELPSVEIEDDGELVDFQWPARTVEWWRMWAETPLSDDFTQTDWDFLLDTAMLHARFWRGDHKVAAELRLRVAKVGATPEDRARLRITFAQADEADEKRDRTTGAASRGRRGGLKALPDEKASGE